MTKSAMIPEAEWEIMRIIWTTGTISSSDVIANLQEKTSWTESTIKTLLRRLVAQGWLKTEKQGRKFLYTPTIDQTEMMYRASMDMLDRMCDMHKGTLLIQLLQAVPMSKTDLKKLASLANEKAVTAPETVPCNCLPNNLTKGKDC